MAGKVSSDPNVFLLPDIGEGLQEAEVIRWLVKEGDRVEENQALAEVQTDKALTEIPSPRAGVIAKIHGADGQIMKVHEPFVTYVGDGAAKAAPAPKPASKSTEQPSSKPASNNGTGGDAEIDVPERTQDDGTVVGKMSGDLAGMTASPGKALATPAVRRLARDLGVDIDSVTGTGIGGRVTEKDVRAAAEGSSRSAASGVSAAPAAPRRATPSAAPAPAPKPAPRAAIPQGAESLRIPIRDVRRVIANRLRQSVDRAVHFTVMDEADVTALDGLRKKLGAASGEKVSFLPFVCAAVARVLSGEFGALNATVDDDRSEIIQHRAVHLGIATDTENGLMVPVLPDCDRLGVLEISRQIAALAEAARNRTASRDQLSGSTFTVSNVGSYAGRFATPIINYPEVGILAVGRTRDGVVTRDGWFKVGKLMPLSLACDHRVVDGATAALALAEIVKLLESPDQLLGPARG